MYSDQDQLFYSHGRPVCKQCLGETLRDQESGEDVCISCGAVSNAPGSCLQVPASRVAMAQELNRGPTVSVMRSDIEMPTIVGRGNFDAKGRQIGQEHEMRQLRKLGAIVSWDPKRRRMARISTEIRRLSEGLGLGGGVSLRAFEIYSKVFHSDGAKVKSVAAAAAAAVCVACLEMEIPRPPDDIIALKANVHEQRLRYHYKILVKNACASRVPDPAIYVSSIAARASLDGVAERKALEILARTRGSDRLVGKRPMSIAAAALYLASMQTGDPRTQMRLAFAARISPATIRKCSGELASILEEKASAAV